MAPNLRKALLAAHIASSGGLVGADLVLLALGIVGRGGADPATAYPAASLVASWVILPLAYAALASGVMLGAFGTWGLLRHWWVALKLVVTVVLSTLVVLVVVPGLARAADAATTTDPAQVLTDSQRLMYVITPSVATGFLLLNIVLAVVKPRWRLR